MQFHVVAEHYRAPHPVEFTVSEKMLSLSGEGFSVCDPYGNVIFKMDGHLLTIRDRCTLLDSSGNPILTARRKVKTQLYVYLKGNETEDVPDFEVKGDCFVRSSRKTNLRPRYVRI